MVSYSKSLTLERPHIHPGVEPGLHRGDGLVVRQRGGEEVEGRAGGFAKPSWSRIPWAIAAQYRPHAAKLAVIAMATSAGAPLSASQAK